MGTEGGGVDHENQLPPSLAPVHKKLALPLIIIIVSYQQVTYLQYRQKNRTYNVACSRDVIGLHIIKYTTPTGQSVLNI